MASSEMFKALCIYCYKPATGIKNVTGTENGSENGSIFLKLISRHLKINRTNTACFAHCSPKPCYDCLGIISKFCELYDQLKCLELELNWQVDKLWNVMRWADRVPSRLKAFKNTVNFESKLEFRKIFKRKCKRNFSHQLPRIRISFSKTEIPADKFVRDQENVINSKEVEFAGTGQGTESHHDKIQERKAKHIFLGWISSLAALIFLYNLEISTTKKLEVHGTAEEPLESLHLESDSVAQFILEPEPRTSELCENDCDDLASNEDCYEIQQSPYNCSTYDIGVGEEPSTCLNNVIQQEKDSSLELVIPSASPDQPLFLVEENPQILSSVLNVESGPSSEYEVPVMILEKQEFLDQECHAFSHPKDKEFITPVISESHVAPNIEIGDVKLAFSSTPFLFTSSLHQKRVAPEEEHDESSVRPRRSLRTKFQCSKCKATFSDAKRFEKHSNSCSKANDMESDIDSEEQEEQAVVKVDVDIQPQPSNQHSDSYDDLPSSEAPSFLGQSHRYSLKRATKIAINSVRQNDDDWVANDGDDGAKSESDISFENDSSAEEINYEAETKTGRFPGHVPICTKCDLKFTSRSTYKLHENYKHSKGNTHISTTDVKKMNLTRNSLKLEGLSLETSFECSVDPNQCSRKYPLSKELEKHSKLHGQFTCPICDLTLTDALDLIDHELEHTDKQQMLKDNTFRKGDIYHCARCDFKAAVTQEILNHYLSEHLELPEIDAQCPICQQRFPYYDTVPLTHYLNYHDLNRLDNPGDRVICNEAYCSAYFLREDQLHKHWTMEHSNLELKLAEVKRAKRKKINSNKLKLKKTYSCKCPRCSRTFSCIRGLKLHISTDHVKKTWKSLGDRVISKDGLTVADWVFEKKAKYFCKVDGCKNKFREEDAFQSHSKLHGEFPCNFCEVVKTFAGDLAIHELMHVDKVAEVKTTSQPESMRFRCSRCPFKTGMKDRLVDHFVWKHLGLLIDKKKCPICKHGFSASYKYNSDTDMARNLKPKIYQHFIEWHDFTGIKGGEKGAFKCDKCSAYFRTNLQLMQHTEEVHDSPCPNIEEIGGKVCQDCGMGFVYENSLRNHRVEKHMVELKFACEVADCGEKFETARKLGYHYTYQHGGKTSQERAFVCTHADCEKKFFVKSAYIAHVKCHNPKKERPAKPHICEQCGKSFKHLVQLQSHHKFHKGADSWEFACEVCGKKIFSQQKLTEHMRVHTKEKPFVCQVCGMAYGHRHNLRIHVNSKHKEIKDVPKKRDTTNFASSRKGKKLK